MRCIASKSAVNFFAHAARTRARCGERTLTNIANMMAVPTVRYHSQSKDSMLLKNPWEKSAFTNNKMKPVFKNSARVVLVTILLFNAVWFWGSSKFENLTSNIRKSTLMMIIAPEVQVVSMATWIFCHMKCSHCGYSLIPKQLVKP